MQTEKHTKINLITLLSPLALLQAHSTRSNKANIFSLIELKFLALSCNKAIQSKQTHTHTHAPNYLFRSYARVSMVLFFFPVGSQFAVPLNPLLILRQTRHEYEKRIAHQRTFYLHDGN